MIRVSETEVARPIEQDLALAGLPLSMTLPTPLAKT
jgi:hypothetical protein